MVRQDTVAEDILAAVKSFSEAFGRHDLDAAMERMTPDCVWEAAVPSPDGARHVGQQYVRSAFKDFFANNPNSAFEVEEVVVVGDRVLTRWTRTAPTRIRGVDIYRVRDGKVAEKLTYSKRPS
jgi:ketosteroid isomerase-like protein